MNINWLVRIKNPLFWTAAIPAILIAAQAILALFGIAWDYSELSVRLIAIVDAIFAVLVIFGVVNDPTTKGAGDSSQALEYEEPREG